MSKLPIVKGDYHLIVNDKETEFNSTADLYRWDGVKQWSKTCLAKGQTSDYRLKNGDTPPRYLPCRGMYNHSIF